MGTAAGAFDTIPDASVSRLLLLWSWRHMEGCVCGGGELYPVVEGRVAHDVHHLPGALAAQRAAGVGLPLEGPAGLGRPFGAARGCHRGGRGRALAAPASRLRFFPLWI